MKKYALLGLILLTGCAGVRQDSSYAPNTKITGTLKANFSYEKIRIAWKVQEFRSLLESLEYRVTEKPK